MPEKKSPGEILREEAARQLSIIDEGKTPPIAELFRLYSDLRAGNEGDQTFVLVSKALRAAIDMRSPFAVLCLKAVVGKSDALVASLSELPVLTEKHFLHALADETMVTATPPITEEEPWSSGDHTLLL